MGGKSSIDTFKNTGTIKGKVRAIYSSSGTFKSIINEESGLIQSDGSGIHLESFYDNGTKGDLVENKGTIEAGDSGIFFAQATEISSVKNSGTIKAKDGIKLYDWGYGTSKSISLNNSENSGAILASQDGIVITDQRKDNSTVSISIGSITNSGTILAGRHGINISDIKNPYQIGKINLSGKIIGQSGAGLYIGAGHQLSQDITLSGSNSLLAGGQAGVINSGILGNQDKSGGIKLKDGATISALNSTSKGLVTLAANGPAILNMDNGIIYGNTELENGSKLIGGVANKDNGSLLGDIIVKGKDSEVIGGISNSDNGKIEGSIKLENGGKVDTIVNEGSGTISGDISIGKDSSISNVVNQGEGSIGGGITVEGGGKLENITNAGNSSITGDITVSEGSKVEIDNQGTVGKNEKGDTITVEGGGSANIKDWVVGTDKDGNVDKIVIGGEGKDNTTVDKITIDQGGLDLGGVGNIDNIISGINPDKIGSIGSSGTEVDYALDPITGKLQPKIKVASTIGQAMSRSLITTTTRRTMFIDTIMANAMQSFSLMNNNKAQRIALMDKNLYADANNLIKSDMTNNKAFVNELNRNTPKENSLFILPYQSSQYVDLGVQGISKGHTSGMITGYTTLKDSGIYGVYFGTEKTNMSTGYFDVDNKSYYAGLKYFNSIYSLFEEDDVFMKVHSKAAFIKNDLKKYIGGKSASANPDSYAYGLSVATGLNYTYNDNIFTPEFNLGYEGGYTKAYSMVGEAALKHERYYTHKLNLFNAQGSLSWFRDWHPNLKTVLQAGYKFAINPTIESTVNFSGIVHTGSSKLNRWNEFIGASFIVPLNDAFYFSLNYNGMFAKNGQTHTGFAEFNYAW